MITTNYIEEHKERFLEELFELIRIPSIGGEKQYAKETRQAANFILKKLEEAGTDKAYIIETKGQPIVYAEKTIDPLLPTILVYGHYDVQPADPLSAWTTPPFEPHIRDGNIYARGSSDDKGQLYAQIKAFETMLATDQLSCNVKFLIEGEEEIGSPNMGSFLADPKHLELLKADVVLVSDTTIHSMEQPTILVGLRGVVMFEVTVKGAKRDLHSGVYGGVAPNPLRGISALVSALHDQQHKVTIPEFYDDVVVFNDEKRQLVNYSSFDESAYKKEIGVQTLVGEKDYSIIERVGIRPALDANGIWGGTLGVKKTVIPAEAHAILSIRFVPNQDPKKIMANLEKHLDHLGKTLPALAGMEVSYQSGATSTALTISPDSRAVKALKTAYAKGWGGKPAQLQYEGASIPLLAELQSKLKCDIALLGFGLNSDNIHSPNEKLGLENYYRGIKTTIAFYHAFAQG